MCAAMSRGTTGESVRLFEDMRRRWKRDPDRVQEEAPTMAVALMLLDTYADELDRLRGLVPVNGQHGPGDRVPTTPDGGYTFHLGCDCGWVAHSYLKPDEAWRRLVEHMQLVRFVAAPQGPRGQLADSSPAAEPRTRPTSSGAESRADD